MFFAPIEIRSTKNKGRGVFAVKNIAANKIIEVAPVLVFNKTERAILEKTNLYNYIFEWGDESLECCVGFGYTSMYNHACPSNCEYEMDFENQTMAIRTMRKIMASEELTINYMGDFDEPKPVWWFKTLD